MRPTTLHRPDTDFEPFSQTAGLNYWYCDTVSCALPAEWERTVRGVRLLYCGKCKQKAEGAEQ